MSITPFAQRLAQLREANQWTQAELAARSGLSRSTINRLENGRVKPTTKVIASLIGPLIDRNDQLLREVFGNV